MTEIVCKHRVHIVGIQSALCTVLELGNWTAGKCSLQHNLHWYLEWQDSIICMEVCEL